MSDHSLAPPAGDDRVAELERDIRLYERLSGNDSLDALLDLLVEELDASGPVDGYTVRLVDSERANMITHRLRMPPGYEQLTDTLLGVKNPLNDEADLANLCLRSGVTLYTDKESIKQYPEVSRIRFDYMGAHTMVIVPVIGRGEALGTVIIYNQQTGVPQPVVARLEQLSRMIGGQIGVALCMAQLARREEALRAAEAGQQEFLRFLVTVSDVTSAEHIYREVSAELLRRYPFDMVGMCLREADDLVVQSLILGTSQFADRFRRVEEFYKNTRFALQPSGGLPLTFLQNSPMHFPDMGKLKDVPMHPKDRKVMDLLETPRTLHMSPIRRKGEAVGVFWLFSMSEQVPLSDDDKGFIELLGSFIGAALGHAQLNDLVAKQYRAIEDLNGKLEKRVEDLAVQASTDKLTGLHNFHFFEGELNRRLNEAGRRSTQQGLSLAIFDVDHFKRFNDTYGHVAGNEVLQEVARRVKAVSRQMDIPCRYGGEEFVVILPKCDLDGAALFAERVRSEIASTPFYVGGECVAISISAGCAQYRPTEEFSRFLDRADRALYRAKSAGRNCVQMAAAD